MELLQAEASERRAHVMFGERIGLSWFIQRQRQRSSRRVAEEEYAGKVAVGSAMWTLLRR
jgi:hypothetical protein